MKGHIAAAHFDMRHSLGFGTELLLAEDLLLDLEPLNRLFSASKF
jgi:hypothetical protein